MNEPELDRTRALLTRLGKGDVQAQERLYRLVCSELRGVAGGLMKEQAPDHTLQPTALVHEAWIRLVGGADRSFENRKHFLGVASKAMRSVLVDHVRGKRAGKRGGGAVAQELGEASGLDVAVACLETGPTDLLDLEEALRELEGDDPELARLVELRYFCGLSQADTAAAFGVSVSTVERMWRIARARLHRALAPPEQQHAEERGHGPLA